MQSAIKAMFASNTAITVHQTFDQPDIVSTRLEDNETILVVEENDAEATEFNIRMWALTKVCNFLRAQGEGRQIKVALDNLFKD